RFGNLHLCVAAARTACQRQRHGGDEEAPVLCRDQGSPAFSKKIRSCPEAIGSRTRPDDVQRSTSPFEGASAIKKETTRCPPGASVLPSSRSARGLSSRIDVKAMARAQLRSRSGKRARSHAT